jgi:DNA-directed RNA polymerase specialized sigma24 family protein
MTIGTVTHPACDRDIEHLYRRLAGRLEQIVRLDVHAPQPLIEDACQFAWGRLLCHSARVRRETALAWLATTAVHEAFKLLRQDRREFSLEAAVQNGAAPATDPRVPGPYEIIERRDRIAGLRRLPARQQRLLWLRGLGLSYAEMSVHEGCTERTVERQLLHATQAMRSSTRPAAHGG